MFILWPQLAYSNYQEQTAVKKSWKQSQYTQALNKSICKSKGLAKAPSFSLVMPKAFVQIIEMRPVQWLSVHSLWFSLNTAHVVFPLLEILE